MHLRRGKKNKKNKRPLLNGAKQNATSAERRKNK